MDMEKTLQELQIPEEVYKKAAQEVSNIFFKDELKHCLYSWEDFYSGMLKGKTPVERKAVLLALIIFINVTVNLFFEILQHPKTNQFKKYEGLFRYYDLYTAFFQIGLAGGITYLADPVKLVNELFGYLEDLEREKEQKKKEDIEDLERKKLVLEIVCLGALTSLPFLFKEFVFDTEKELSLH